MGEQRDADEDDRGERHRADERDGGRLLVRLEPDARDDGADPLAALHHRERVETDRLLEADRALRATRERARRPPSAPPYPAAAPRLASPEKTQTGPLMPSCRSRPVAHDELPVDDVERRELLLRLGAGDGDRVVGEPLAEDEVEGGDADHERDRDRADRGEQEPRANARSGAVSSQRVPDAVDGVDPGRTRQRLQLAPQPGDVDVERVVVDDRAVRPARLDELAAPDRRTRAWRRAGRGGGTRSGSARRAPAAHRGVRARIEREAAGLHRQVGAAALDERAQPRHELREGERLRQVVVSSGREPGEAVGECIPGREEEDGDRSPCARSAWTRSRPSASGRPMSTIIASAERALTSDIACAAVSTAETAKPSSRGRA